MSRENKPSWILPVGNIYYDWETPTGLRVLVAQGPPSVNAYIGVPKGHPWYGKEYESVDVDCHGGLTFSDNGGRSFWHEGWWWFGWDYAHAGDKTVYDLLVSELQAYKGHLWTPEEVKAEAEEVVKQFDAGNIAGPQQANTGELK